MRIATPFSLLVVTLVPADGDDIITLGPFSSVSSMDDKLTAEPYPDGENHPDKTVAYYDPETRRWFSRDGRPLIIWTFNTVDEVCHRGHAKERQKADYIRREFPPEDTSVFAK